MIARLELVAAVMGFAGCAQIEPDVGPRLAGGCDNSDSNPDVTVSFSRNIRPLITRTAGGCAACHVPSGGAPGPGTRLSGLDLSSLAALRNGGVGSGPDIVITGQPCASIIYQKVSPAPPFGSRMPLGGPYLTAEEIGLLHDWVAEGAADN